MSTRPEILFPLFAALDTLEGMTFDTEVYIDHKPATHAFAGERKRMTEADVLEMVGASGDG